MISSEVEEVVFAAMVWLMESLGCASSGNDKVIATPAPSSETGFVCAATAPIPANTNRIRVRLRK